MTNVQIYTDGSARGNPDGPGGFQLLIDRQPAHAWFRQRYVELMTRLGYPVRPERPVVRRHTIKR